jgi:hypothetical protein
LAGAAADHGRAAGVAEAQGCRVVEQLGIPSRGENAMGSRAIRGAKPTTPSLTGAPPQPDKACGGRLPFLSRLTQGPAVSVADRHHSLRLGM